jgi:VWFA-related protein
LVVTDGQDNASIASIDRIRRKVERTDVVIFTIGLLADETAGHASRARQELKACADMTGGRAFFPERVDEITTTALDVAHQLRSQYTIAFAPQNQSLDGTYRRITVTVRGPDRLSVRTRSGYLASREDEITPRSTIRRR